MPETERKQLLPYALIAILFFGSTLTIILSIDPYTAGFWALLSFYVSLGVFLTAFFGFFLYLGRIKAVQMLPYEKHQIAFREGLLLAILIVGSFILAAAQLLLWWVEIVFVIAIVCVEIFFLI